METTRVEDCVWVSLDVVGNKSVEHNTTGAMCLNRTLALGMDHS